MADRKQLDFLIIGLGLSGGLLAWELIQRGCRVLVIDNGEVNASHVAAGLVNPVTGKRIAKTPDVDSLLPAAKDCYVTLSAVFKRPFLIEKPMLRLLRSETEVAQCLRRLNDGAYRRYLGRLRSSGNLAGFQGAAYGYLEQKQTGYLDTQPLLARLLEFLRSRNAYQQTELDYREIRLDPELSWRDLRPRQLVFCEGFKVRENPWFSWLPLRPVKGEILTLTHDFSLPDQIINDGHWLVPVGQRQVRLGATFDRTHIDTRISENGKAELWATGEKFYPGLRQAKLHAHLAGIRPCTQDRQPFLGKHPKYSQLNIFNGFGAKGSLSIPWHCRCFADYLLTGKALPHSSDIKRYEKSLFPGC
ncbi:MAG: NAD(P)/FAD-dependent oxidoreductase [Gammaproteobacteria bacterium]